MSRSRGRIVLAAIYLLLALNAWTQVILGFAGHGTDSRALLAFQSLLAIAALIAAWGCWHATPWAAAAALLYGLVTATMLLSLASLLNLPPSARGGLWTGAAAVMLFALWATWYLRRRRAHHADGPR